LYNVPDTIEGKDGAMSEQTSGEKERGAGGDGRPFLGSWFALRGRKQTDYFLGSEVVRQWETQKTLPEFALLKDVEMVCSGALNNR
jgi:hypothetical protein